MVRIHPTPLFYDSKFYWCSMELNIEKRLLIGLYLFSKGNEFVEFGIDQVEKIKGFASDRYEEGKAFLEKQISDYEGSSFAMSTETLRIAALEAIADSDDFSGRLNDLADRYSVSDITFGRWIMKSIIESPDEVRQIIADYKPENVELFTQGIPDDFEQGESVTLTANSRPYSEPTETERAELLELTGAGFSEHTVILDSGTTPGHEYLRDHEHTLSEVPSEPSGIDRNFHGTHVEGTAAGTEEISTNYRCKVSSIQVFDSRGSGLMSWLAAGLRKAREIGATVINYSGGASGTRFIDPEVEMELRLCQEAGIIVVIAAGNDGWRQGQDTANSPGRSEYASCIGAVGPGDELTQFGSGGPSVDSAHYGQGIISADFRGGLASSNGTSMATPNDADDASNVQSFMVKNGFARLDGTRGGNEFKKEHADDLFSPGHDGPTGYGILRVLKKLKELSPDDVKQLATNKKPSGKLATMIALLFSLVACGSCDTANAQDIVELKTVVTTIERTEVFRGDVKLSSVDSVVGSPSESITELKAIEFGGDATKAVVMQSDLKPRTIESFEPGRFVLAPGEYLVFPHPFVAGVKRFVIEDPEPAYDVTTIAPMAKGLADALNDQPTRQKLVTAYTESIYGMNTADDLDGAGEIVKQTILQVWPTRTGDSLQVDWVNGFQRPLQAEFNRLQIGSIKQYQDSIQEVIKGLQSQE